MRKGASCSMTLWLWCHKSGLVWLACSMLLLRWLCGVSCGCHCKVSTVLAWCKYRQFSILRKFIDSEGSFFFWKLLMSIYLFSYLLFFYTLSPHFLPYELLFCCHSHTDVQPTLKPLRNIQEGVLRLKQM